MFRQPSGSDEGAGAIKLRESQKRLRADTIRSPAALPRMAVRGRAFLSEQADDSWIRCDKGGLGWPKGNPPPKGPNPAYELTQHLILRCSPTKSASLEGYGPGASAASFEGRCAAASG